MQSFELASARLDGDRRGAPALTVHYDPRCPLCRRLKAWLERRPTVVPLAFMAAASPEARTRFPGLDHQRTTTVLTVVAADGAVFEEERAWLACAWALPGWQPVAEQFGSRPGRTLVRLVARAVDRHRRRGVATVYGPACDTCGTIVRARR